MTDAHFHEGGHVWLELRGERFRFCGIHPWNAGRADAAEAVDEIRRMVEADPSAGVGEIGLDRLKTKSVTDSQREVFLAQLSIAADMHRPVVLHGAKCWGEVVRCVKPFAGAVPAFLFHGFSRSGGLVPDIEAVNGFVGVGTAVLNDRAVNYRELVRRLPEDRILAETDFDGGDGSREDMLRAVVGKITELSGVTEERLDGNAAAFAAHLSGTVPNDSYDRQKEKRS